MKPIFCSNFEYDAQQSDLERLFERYGKVNRVDMKSGFAFIYMEDERDADDAIRGLDRREFGRKGRRLHVEWTKHERAASNRKHSGGGSRRSSTSTKPSKTLFVFNFDPYHTMTKDLERHFESYGKIVSVRIRRNFAFVQYESQDDATRALDSTNMSKLMDRVISVEYTVRDDDEKRNGSTSERNRGRSPDRRRQSPSPYRRERDSPDYGRGPGPFLRERASPDYGRGCSISLSRRDKSSPDYGHGISRSPPQRERGSFAHGRYRSPENVRGPIGGKSHWKDEAIPGNNRRTSLSPCERERVNSDNGRGSSPNVPEVRDSPYGKPESPPRKRHNRLSPPEDD